MKAITVNGLVEREDLGFTLPHEHLYCDLASYCTNGSDSAAPIESVPIADLQRRPLDFRENLDMRDVVTAEAELAAFASAGGRTVVELTTIGLAPDREVLRRLSLGARVHVVAGTGYYTAPTHPASLKDMSIDAIAAEMMRDIREGDAVNGIRSGIIGEIGTSDPMHPTELKVVQAAARAQLATGCPISLHFSPGLREVFHVFAALEGEGLTTLGRVVVGHADDVLDIELHKEIVAAGAMVEYDTFGNEGYTSPFGRPMPSDLARVAALAQLVDAGCADHVLVSQDVCMKSLWSRYGGHGYTNIFARVAPMLTEAGVSESIQSQISVANPARLLAFVS